MKTLTVSVVLGCFVVQRLRNGASVEDECWRSSFPSISREVNLRSRSLPSRGVVTGFEVCFLSGVRRYFSRACASHALRRSSGVWSAGICFICPYSGCHPAAVRDMHSSHIFSAATSTVFVLAMSCQRTPVSILGFLTMGPRMFPVRMISVVPAQRRSTNRFASGEALFVLVKRIARDSVAGSTMDGL